MGILGQSPDSVLAMDVINPVSLLRDQLVERILQGSYLDAGGRMVNSAVITGIAY